MPSSSPIYHPIEHSNIYPDQILLKYLVRGGTKCIAGPKTSEKFGPAGLNITELFGPEGPKCIAKPKTSEIFGPGGRKCKPGPKMSEIFGPVGLKTTRTKYFVTGPFCTQISNYNSRASVQVGALVSERIIYSLRKSTVKSAALH